MDPSKNDLRFATPLYSTAEAAFFLRVPASTLDTWIRGYVRRPKGRAEVQGAPLITTVETERGWPRITFVGLAEAHVLAAFRKAGVSLQHIRQALEILRRESGIEHILASQQLYTDGQRVLYDYAGNVDATLASDNDAGVVDALTEVVSGQRVFRAIIRRYLERISYDDSGWAQRLLLPISERPIVAADPNQAFGKPVFVHGAVRVKDVLDRWRAGDPLSAVSDDFGVPLEDIEDVLRAAVPEAA